MEHCSIAYILGIPVVPNKIAPHCLQLIMRNGLRINENQPFNVLCTRWICQRPFVVFLVSHGIPQKTFKVYSSVRNHWVHLIILELKSCYKLAVRVASPSSVEEKWSNHLLLSCFVIEVYLNLDIVPSRPIIKCMLWRSSDLENSCWRVPLINIMNSIESSV